MPGGQLAGMLILVTAFRDGSTTQPTVPATFASSGGGGNLSAMTVGFRVASADNESVGTWTGATGVCVTVYSKAAAEEWMFDWDVNIIGGNGTGATITFPDNNWGLFSRYSEQWIQRASAQRNATNLTTNTPTGYTARVGTATECRVMDSNGDFGQITANDFGGNTQSTNGSTGWWGMTTIFGVYTPVGNISCMNRAEGADVFATDPFAPYYRNGDLLLAFAQRTSATAASLPAGWTNISALNSGSFSGRVAYQIATSDANTGIPATSMGVWTNATNVEYLVYRNHYSPGSWDVPTVAANTGTGTASITTLSFPDLTGVTTPNKAHMFVRPFVVSPIPTPLTGWRSATGFHYTWDSTRDVSGNASAVGGNSVNVTGVNAWVAWTVQLSGTGPPSGNANFMQFM